MPPARKSKFEVAKEADWPTRYKSKQNYSAQFAGIYIDLPVTATVNISEGTVATATLNAEDKVVDAANVTLTSAGIFRLELKNATSISSNSSSPNATVSLL